jgi:Asp-tRNA(Asn)/Glu-tRNA(Gln) amidotransferase B subunit
MNKEIRKALTTPLSEYTSVPEARTALLNACGRNSTSARLAREYVNIMIEIGHLKDNDFTDPETIVKQKRSQQICDELLIGESIGEY